MLVLFASIAAMTSSLAQVQGESLPTRGYEADAAYVATAAYEDEAGYHPDDGYNSTDLYRPRDHFEARAAFRSSALLVVREPGQELLSPARITDGGWFAALAPRHTLRDQVLAELTAFASSSELPVALARMQTLIDEAAGIDALSAAETAFLGQIRGRLDRTRTAVDHALRGERREAQLAARGAEERRTLSERARRHAAALRDKQAQAAEPDALAAAHSELQLLDRRLDTTLAALELWLDPATEGARTPN